MGKVGLPPQPSMEVYDHGMISLEAALQNNELFMEFLEYLESVKAPPYLQFMMNVDALRQFASMSLGIDNKASNAIDDYFRSGQSLTQEQMEQLKMIKHDAADVYRTHFADAAKYRIPLDPGMQQELQEWVTRSDRLDESQRYIGGPIGQIYSSLLTNGLQMSWKKSTFPSSNLVTSLNASLIVHSSPPSPLPSMTNACQFLVKIVIFLITGLMETKRT